MTAFSRSAVEGWCKDCQHQPQCNLIKVAKVIREATIGKDPVKTKK